MHSILIIILMLFAGISYSQLDSTLTEVDSLEIPNGVRCYIKDINGVVTFYDSIVSKKGFRVFERYNYIMSEKETQIKGYYSALYYKAILVKGPKMKYYDSLVLEQSVYYELDKGVKNSQGIREYKVHRCWDGEPRIKKYKLQDNGVSVVFADSTKSILILSALQGDVQGILIDFNGELVELNSGTRKKEKIIILDRIVKAVADYPDVKRKILKLYEWKSSFSTPAMVLVLKELERLYLTKYLVEL